MHEATPSNCRNDSLDHPYRPHVAKAVPGTTAKVVGMVITGWVERIGSQVLKGPLRGPMDAVHRLNGGGFGVINNLRNKSTK